MFNHPAYKEQECGAVAVVNFLTAMQLFAGQSPAFFSRLMKLAMKADNARSRVEDEGEFLEQFFDKN